MVSLQLFSNIKQRRQFVRHLKREDRLAYLTDEQYEGLTGKSAILSEELADARVAAILRRVKLNVQHSS